jgi:hypothetical protein
MFLSLAAPYLDIVRDIKNLHSVPIAIYHVSGEYAMLHAAAARGAFGLLEGTLEALMGAKRAGAGILITYSTPLLLKHLASQLPRPPPSLSLVPSQHMAIAATSSSAQHSFPQQQQLSALPDAARLPASSHPPPIHLPANKFHGIELSIPVSVLHQHLLSCGVLQDPLFRSTNKNYTQQDFEQMMTPGAPWPSKPAGFQSLYITPAIVSRLQDSRKDIVPSRGGRVLKEAREVGVVPPRNLKFEQRVKIAVRHDSFVGNIGIYRLFKAIWMSAAEKARLLALPKAEFELLSCSHLDSGKSTLGRFEVCPEMVTYESSTANASRNACQIIFDGLMKAMETDPVYKNKSYEDRFDHVSCMLRAVCCKGWSVGGCHPNDAVGCVRHRLAAWELDLCHESQRAKAEGKPSSADGDAVGAADAGEDDTHAATAMETGDETSVTAMDISADDASAASAASNDLTVQGGVDAGLIEYVRQAEQFVRVAGSKKVRCLHPGCGHEFRGTTRLLAAHRRTHEGAEGAAKKRAEAENTATIQAWLDDGSAKVTKTKAGEVFKCLRLATCGKEVTTKNRADFISHVAGCHLPSSHPLAQQFSVIPAAARRKRAKNAAATAAAELKEEGEDGEGDDDDDEEDDEEEDGAAAAASSKSNKRRRT